MKGILKVQNLPLLFIFLLGIFARTYNFEKSFSFSHDQDLYSWIARDIIVNHHQRLVGQITSVAGVFIGSFYYYLMALFYWIFRFNPLSAEIPLTLIGLGSLLSIYLMTNKHFGVKAALVASFIYAVSVGIAFFDRWSVPTEPTLLWSIWFLWVCLELAKGNLRYLPIYGILIGYLWQLHIALIPVLPIPILAYFVGGNKLRELFKKDNLKLVGLSFVFLAVSLSPLIIFELKHNFSQVRSILVANNNDLGGPTGMMKFLKVVDASAKEIQQRIVYGWELKDNYLIWLGLVVIFLTTALKKWIKLSDLFIFVSWLGAILITQFWSKRIVSEYYFTNIVPVVVVWLSIFLVNVFNGKLIAITGVLYMSVNMFWLFSKSDVDHSYFYRKELVDYIKEDVGKHEYPCIAVNYIADPGVGVGFRYLFWYKGIKLVKPGTENVPIYNISIPWQISGDEISAHFGRFGVIVPNTSEQVTDRSVCDLPNNQIDPLLGYTE